MKNLGIQVLRGMAIISVILIHTCPQGLWQVYCRSFFNFGVPLFLFLSGYLTSWNQENWPRFFKKRLLRVLIPYILWTIIYTLVRRQPERMLFNLATTQGAFHLYFIFVYIQFVLLTPIIKWLAESKYRAIGWMIAPLSILVFNYSGLVFDNPLPGKVTLLWYLSFLGWFSYYYLGILARHSLIPQTHAQKPFYWALLGVAMIIQLAEGRILMGVGFPDPGTPLKISALLFNTLLMLAALTYLKKERSRYPRFLVLLGDCSFGIYLSHVLFVWLFAKTPVLEALPFPVTSILALFSSLALVVSFRFISGERVGRWIGFV